MDTERRHVMTTGPRPGCRGRPGFRLLPRPASARTRVIVEVDDLAAETAQAVAEGSRLAEYQPQDGVRVLLDPSRRPFCLWTQAAQ
ncbi:MULTISPECIES: VOC family protein [unclassified Streptomyces]|uniref:VOC family protein n=1 Tax=unclassified Streptomyces TaxID=2593676 RepID=UPI0033349495